jgi:hypothetical protein
MVVVPVIMKFSYSLPLAWGDVIACVVFTFARVNDRLAVTAGVSAHRPLPLLLSPPPQRVAAAVEGRQEALAELLIHEAVRDGVAAAGDVTQQVYEVHRDRTHMPHRRLLVKHPPRAHHIHRRPEHKELENHHEEHLDDALLGLEAPIRVALAHPGVELPGALEVRQGDDAVPLSTSSRARHHAVPLARHVFLGLHVVVLRAGGRVRLRLTQLSHL